MKKQETIPQYVIDSLGKISTGIGIFDVTGDAIDMKYINEGYYQMIGDKRDARSRFFGTGTINAIYYEDRPGLLYEAKASIKENRVFRFRFRVLNGDGTYRWVGINANHEKLDDKTERFFASYYSVDDLVIRQNQLERYSEERDAILDRIPGGVAIFSYQNGEIRLEYTNPGFYTLHHGGEEYWKKQSANPIDWLYDDDRSLFNKEFEAVNSGLKSEGDVAYRIIGSDGKNHWVNNQFRFVYEQDGVRYYYASFTDLDTQKEAENARIETQQMYEAAIEEAKLAVWEYDLVHRRVIMAENTFTAYDHRKFGLPHIIDNVPDSLVPYIDEASVPAFLEMYEQVQNGAARADCIVWYKLRPGTEPRCEHISYTTSFDEDGRPYKAFGIGQNITAQKREEEEYERIRNQLTDNLTDLASSVQLNLSKNAYLNGYSPFPQVLESLKKATADEHFAAAASSIPDKKIKNDILLKFNCANLLNLYKSGTERIEVEYPIRASYGETLWIHTTLTLMQNPGTGDVEAITSSKNITKQRQSEQILQHLARENCDYIGIIHSGNGTFELHDGLWGRDDTPIGKLFPYDDIRSLRVDAHLNTEEGKTLLSETDLPVILKNLKDKTQYIVSYNDVKQDLNERRKKEIRFSWLDETQKDILAIQTDVTETYQKEQMQIAALEEAKRKADAANQAKSDFLSSMSHDIRTPLNGIIGMSYLASEQTNPPKTVDCLKKIDTSSKYLLSLINDVLDISKAESNKIEFHPEPYPLNEFNSYVDSLVRPLCLAKDQQFEMDEKDVPNTMIPLADKLRMNQIVFNLLSNSVKYTPEGGKILYTIKAKILPGNKMKITHTISDNGIGMSKEFQKRLFQPFTQENQGVIAEAHGTGLGLAIVKKLIDAMGGTIHVKSALGKGTSFIFVLTFDAIYSYQMPRKVAKADVTLRHPDVLKGKRVLLCEDNPLNQEITKAILGEKGVIVELANNGLLGVKAFKESPVGYFDGILMDIHMPEMDGYDATRAIRALSKLDAKKVPIIAMTADAFAEDVKKCLEAGMNGHISKPIDPRQIYSTLSSFLAK
jgi:signal transduction histidine kinase